LAGSLVTEGHSLDVVVVTVVTETVVEMSRCTANAHAHKCAKKYIHIYHMISYNMHNFYYYEASPKVVCIKCRQDAGIIVLISR